MINCLAREFDGVIANLVRFQGNFQSGVIVGTHASARTEHRSVVSVHEWDLLLTIIRVPDVDLLLW